MSSPHPNIAPDIYEFDNYADFLRAWFLGRKAQDPDYSYRRFAKAANQANGTILEAVVAGRRNLTPARAAEFLPELGLDPRAAARFLLLVRRQRAEAQLGHSAAAAGDGSRPRGSRTTAERIDRELAGLDRIERYRRSAPPTPTTLPRLVRQLEQGSAFVFASASDREAWGRDDVTLLKALHQARTESLGRVRNDPGCEDARQGRFLGLTQALAEVNVPRVEEEVASFVRELVAEFGGGSPSGRPFAVCLDLFALTDRMRGEGHLPPPTTPQDDDGPPLIYDFDDSRSFVDRWFHWRRAQAIMSRERFSLQTFAEEADLADRTLPSKIAAGRQGLTEPTARAFARGMGLDQDDEEYLVLLALHEAADSVEAPALLEAIRAARVLARSRKLRARTLRLFSDWYHFAIQEMAWCAGMPHDPSGVAAALRPRVEPASAASALRTLQDLGMLIREPDGSFAARDAALLALRDLQSEALHPVLYAYHQAMHGLGGARLEELARSAPSRHAPGAHPASSPGPAGATALVLSVPRSEAGALQEALGAFSQRLLGFCGGLLPGADRVFQMNLHLLPLDCSPTRA